MRLISIFSSSPTSHNGGTFNKPPRQSGPGLTGLSSSVRRTVFAAPPGRGTVDGTGERAPSHCQTGRSSPQSSLRNAQAPAHRHPSILHRFVKKIHLQVAPHTQRETTSLLAFVIRKSPARIRGLAIERFARMAGEIEKCPACPQECPVSEESVRVIGRSSTNRVPNHLTSAPMSKVG
jgi:hypothetical protein